MLVLLARLLAAATSPIPDCDEVFNFWEPTHFITHGSGFQTWEWSPVYAIRSWAYVGLHAALILPFKRLGVPDKYLFYILRSLFALFEAFTEYQLYKAIKKYDKTAAYTFTVLSAAATGLLHASVSYLPSSFGMYFVTWAAALFIQDPEANVVKYLTLVAIGGLLGWPFVLLISVPFGSYYTAQTISNFGNWFSSFYKTLATVALILAVIIGIDSYVYQRAVVVPFNIVAYNVLFTSEDSGPEIFGVEPWTYYFVNLALNFHAVLPLGLLMPLFESRSKFATVWCAVILWLGTLTSTPHKEERFVYPVYPLICMCAALTLTKLWKLVNSFSRLPTVFFKGGLVCLCVVSILRSLALVNYYSAPLRIYDGMNPNSTVCIGREWYRYPSSYFLSEGSTPQWIKSGFDGLLPGHFSSFSGIPEGMNNKNLYDAGKVDDISHCDYLMEIDAPVNSGAGEVYPNENEWRKHSCSKFLDTENTPTISRLLYTNYKVQWRDYCMYERI